MFEAASIKPSGKGQLIDVLGVVIPQPMRGGPGTDNPGQISFANASLKTLVAAAYGVKRYQVSGPDWLDVTGFNIVAKVAPGATKEQVRLMLQNLLVERFQLALHIDKRELEVYALVVAKGGLKMKPSQSDPEDGGTWEARDGHARWVGPHTTLNAMAEFLSPRLDRPVIDKTGLTGKYDIALTWEAGEPRRARQHTARDGMMPSERRTHAASEAVSHDLRRGAATRPEAGAEHGSDGCAGDRPHGEDALGELSQGRVSIERMVRVWHAAPKPADNAPHSRRMVESYPIMDQKTNRKRETMGVVRPMYSRQWLLGPSPRHSRFPRTECHPVQLITSFMTN